MKHARRITNRMSELRPLSVWAAEVVDGWGCPASRRQDVDLCLNEAVSNIIRHGYTDDAPHEIDIELWREPGVVVVRIEDDARPFDPLKVREPQHDTLDEARPDGRGIVLIRRTADGANYDRRDGRNRLELRFTLDG